MNNYLHLCLSIQFYVNFYPRIKENSRQKLLVILLGVILIQCVWKETKRHTTLKQILQILLMLSHGSKQQNIHQN